MLPPRPLLQAETFRRCPCKSTSGAAQWKRQAATALTTPPPPTSMIGFFSAILQCAGGAAERSEGSRMVRWMGGQGSQADHLPTAA